jgi:hypothetical protein
MESVLHDWLLRQTQRHDVVVIKTYSDVPVEKAFNRLMKKFLESDCPWAFILNSDELPPDDALERLAAHDKDVCSGVCFRWVQGRGPVPVALRRSGEGYTYVWGEGLEQIDRVSMSGVLVKRAVLEAIPLGTFRHPMLDSEGLEWGSPGFALWDEARARGFELWMDFDVRIHHYKRTDLLEVNDLMVKSAEIGREKVLRAVAKMKAQGVPDSEIVAALGGD